jgi:hypothetical protein
VAQRFDRIEKRDEALDGEPSVAPALQSADIAFVRANGARDLTLGQAMGATEHAEFLSQGGHELTARLVTALNVVHCRLLRGRGDNEELTAFEPAQHGLISASLIFCAWIPPIVSYRHRHTSIIVGGRDGAWGRTP